MKDFEELFAINPRNQKFPTDINDLIGFFKERQITLSRIAQVLELTSQVVYQWFNGRIKVPEYRKKELYTLQQKFLDWEEEHGMMFNSEEHRLKLKTDLLKPKTKPPTPKIKNVPYHPCPYEKDGLQFGLDYDEYDVCDDCYLNVACHKYKMKILHPDKKVREKQTWRYRK